ncbi:MAG: hypothetical protein JWL81_3230 [Verrucomicrobiales bacterium]|nr:hypothetical protein [Verrucomicrobiales bacterium]
MGFIALALNCYPCAAQDAAATPPDPVPLHSIQEANRILVDPARTSPVTMRFRGTAIFTSQAGDFCLQDGDAGVMIEPPDPQLRPALGDIVEVEAPIAFHAADPLDPGFFLKTTRAAIVGHGPLPEPVRTNLPAALNGATAGRWVEVEGVIMQSALQNGVVRLHLTDTAGWAVVNVHDWRPGVSLTEGWGARLRIRCANVGRGHTALRVSSTDQITVIKPGTPSLFAAPEADPAALRQGKAIADRLRLTATVLARRDGFFYLRSKQGTPFRANLLQPFNSPIGNGHPLELIPPDAPESWAPGDLVELVGSPLETTPFLQFSFSSFRPVSAGKLPPPASAEGRNPAALACDLVTIRGRLLWGEKISGAAGAGDTLALDCDGTVIHAEVPANAATSGGESGASFQKDDQLAVTGVLFPAEYGRPLTLLATAPPGRSPVLTIASARRGLSPMAWRWIMGLGAGLALALGGAWWLQRKVRQRTAALGVANATLRDEVLVREKAQADLARALEQERELGELKNRFVTMVSHEFRTPLGITMSAVELLRHHHDRLDAAQRTELFDDIHRATCGMGGLMEQVLVLGRVEAGTVGCRRSPCHLDGLAQKLIDESLSAMHRRCPIHWHPGGDLSGAMADEALLRHIFSNLLSNAAKYSPEGAPVHFDCRREGRDAVFTVRDQGCGIPEADRPRLFEAFHRGTNVGDISGTGLGLVIVKRCVDLHGGQVELTTELNQGTTFTIRLPLWAE